MELKGIQGISYTNRTRTDDKSKQVDLYYDIFPPDLMKTWVRAPRTPDMILHLGNEALIMINARYSNEEKERTEVHALMNAYNMDTALLISPDGPFGLVEHDFTDNRSRKILEIPIKPNSIKNVKDRYLPLINELITVSSMIKNEDDHRERMPKITTLTEKAEALLK